jgi:hypothetical protein
MKPIMESKKVFFDNSALALGSIVPTLHVKDARPSSIYRSLAFVVYEVLVENVVIPCKSSAADPVLMQTIHGSFSIVKIIAGGQTPTAGARLNSASEEVR